MKQAIRDSLKLLLKVDVETEKQALEELEKFLSNNGLEDLGISDIKVLTEVACTFSDVPQWKILTPDFHLCFDNISDIDLLDQEIEVFENKLVKKDGDIRRFSKTDKNLFPKKEIEHRKYFAPLLDAISRELPNVRTAWVSRGISLIVGTSVIANFDFVFEREGKLIGHMLFNKIKTEEELAALLPDDIKLGKTINYFIRYKRINLKPVYLEEVIDIILNFDIGFNIVNNIDNDGFTDLDRPEQA